TRRRGERAGPRSLAQGCGLEKVLESGALRRSGTPHGRTVRARHAQAVVLRGPNPETESPIEIAASADHDHRIVPANARDTKGARGVQESPDRPACLHGS